MPTARVCIADDHELFGDGIAQLLNRQPDMQVIGIARDGLEILTLTRDRKPDLILMDIHMPINDGIEATYRIREFDTKVTILMLTALDSEEKLIEAIKAGADGYLLKNTSSEEFVQALRGALKGETTMPAHLTRRLLKDFVELASQPQPAGSESDTPVLTSREIQVLERIAADASNQQIADQLDISLYTVKSHVRNVLSKLSARNRWEAVQRAKEMGLLRSRK